MGEQVNFLYKKRKRATIIVWVVRHLFPKNKARVWVLLIEKISLEKLECHNKQIGPKPNLIVLFNRVLLLIKNISFFFFSVW